MDIKPSDLIVFIVGNSRSGTTMLSRILDRNSRIFRFGELHFFEQIWSPGDENRALSREQAVGLIRRLMAIHHEGYLEKKTSSCYNDPAAWLLSRMREKGESLFAKNIYVWFLRYTAEENGKPIPCEQTPRNLFYLKEIFGIGEGVRCICMVRDPRDVLLSQKNKWRRRFLGAGRIPLKEAFRSWVNYHPIIISCLWKSSVKAMAPFLDNPNFRLVRFEELIGQPEQTVHGLCDFIGVTYGDDMLNVAHLGSSMESDEPEKRGIKKERTGNWRTGGINRTEEFLLQWITRDQMKNQDYEPVPVTPNPITLCYYLFSVVIKLLFAFFLNIGRMKNIPDAIRRRMGG